MASIRVRTRTEQSPTYAVLWRDPGTGKQTSYTLETQQQAENFRRLIEANDGHLEPTRAALVAIARHRPTIRAILEEHIAGLPSVTARSRADYRRDAQLHIDPYLGMVAVEELTPAQVKDYLRKLAATEMADKTIANVHGLLSAAINTAMQAGLRTDNPCRGIRLPRRSEHESVEMVFLTPSEWGVLEQEITAQLGGYYRLLFQTFAATGIRWGEASALRVGDLSLDTEPPTMRISRATRRDENSKAYIGPTKTRRSRRTISLSTKLAVALREAVEGRPVDALVFTSRTGKPIHHSNVRSRIWLPAIAAARDTDRHGIDALVDVPRIHDLRHSHASWLISKGVDLLTVQRRLGHESIKTTSDRYGHLMPGQQLAAALAVDEILG